MVATFDTLQVVKRLKEAGFNERQAEAVIDVVRDLRDADMSQFATKTDIAGLRADIAALRIDMDRGDAGLSADMQRLETSLTADMQRLETKMSMTIDIKISEAKAEIIRWVFGIAFAQAALILTVLKLFPGGHP